MISHPYGRAQTATISEAQAALAAAGAPRQVALVLAAIGQATTGLDLRAVDTDQLRGRLAVGAWGVNYYGPQYQLALQLAGTPAQLAAGDVAQQAVAAVAVWRNAGLVYWQAFTSGAWRMALSAGQRRSVPRAISGRAPAAGIQPTGQDAGARAAASARSALPSIERATAAATQLHNTIGAVGNG